MRPYKMRQMDEKVQKATTQIAGLQALALPRKVDDTA